MYCRVLKDANDKQQKKHPKPTVHSTTLISNYQSLPRNFTSSPDRKSWTLLDTEMVKVKGK